MRYINYTTITCSTYDILETTCGPGGETPPDPPLNYLDTDEHYYSPPRLKADLYNVMYAWNSNGIKDPRGSGGSLFLVSLITVISYIIMHRPYSVPVLMYQDTVVGL